MTNEIANRSNGNGTTMAAKMAISGEDAAQAMEAVLLTGDLSKLRPMERVNYYNAVCQSLNLNPLTQPFEYIALNGKTKLYPKKDCTDQLRKNNKISLTPPVGVFENDLYIVSMTASFPDGRCDSDLGAVSVKGVQGESLANAIMKATTKAKRRVTLAICGLGWANDIEMENVAGARIVRVNAATGEFEDNAGEPPPAQQVNTQTGEVRLHPQDEIRAIILKLDQDTREEWRFYVAAVYGENGDFQKIGLENQETLLEAMKADPSKPPQPPKQQTQQGQEPAIDAEFTNAPTSSEVPQNAVNEQEDAFADDPEPSLLQVERGPNECKDCTPGNMLTDFQRDKTKKTYGRALCQTCELQAKAKAKAEGTAAQ